MNQPPVLDRNHLARYTLGDAALEREVLGLFVDQIPETLDALDRAEGDEGRVMAAHTLKGSARAVGAGRLAAVAEAVERAAREGRATGALRADLAAACEEVRATIRAEGEGPSEGQRHG